ncbi:MAG: endolytic transglycosylase MltG, partial [Methylophilaceae bacterium]
MRFIKGCLMVVLFAALGMSAWLAYYAKMPLNLSPAAQEITIKPKSSLTSIAYQLNQQGVLKQAWPFILLARVLN